MWKKGIGCIVPTTQPEKEKGLFMTMILHSRSTPLKTYCTDKFLFLALIFYILKLLFSSELASLNVNSHGHFLQSYLQLAWPWQNLDEGIWNAHHTSTENFSFQIFTWICHRYFVMYIFKIRSCNRHCHFKLTLLLWVRLTMYESYSYSTKLM